MSWFTRRKATWMAALALPAALTVAGCDGYDDDDYTDGATYDRTAPPAQRDYDDTDDQEALDDDDRLTEAEVLGIAKALNQGEVDHASAVQGRLFDPGVQSSCEMILQDHRAALVKIDQVAQATGIVPLESETSRELAKDVREEIADLQDDEGDELVGEFLSDQEGMHEKALKTFDDELLPASTNPKIVELLTELRATVASHLEHLKQLDDVR